MPALNFKEQFADKVESGKKSQTIRKPRKNPIEVGDTLYLYTGMRTKGCRKLGEAECIDWQTISLHRPRKVGDTTVYGLWEYGFIGDYNLDEIARDDGFDSGKEMLDFFDDLYGLPCRLKIIYW